MSRLRLLAPLVLAALAACNSAEPEAAATPAATPAPVLTTSPAAAEADPGEWQMTQNGAAASARYLAPDGKVLLAITCDLPTRVVSLSVSSLQPGNQTFVLQAGGQAARLDTVSDNNAADPHQMAAIAVNAPVFVGFVQPNGIIEVSQPGLGGVRAPASTAIRDVFEVCQQPAAPAASQQGQ